MMTLESSQPEVARSRSFGPRLRSALVAPPFDPREQSWFAATVSAAQVIVGSGLFLLFADGMLARGPHPRMTTTALLGFLVVSGVLSTSMLWAGLSLMFGWRDRRKAQALLWAVLLAVGFVLLVVKA